MINTTTHSFLPAQLRQLSNFASHANRLGANFAVCDTDGKILLLNSTENCQPDTELLSRLSLETLQSNERIFRYDDQACVIAAPLNINHLPAGVAMLETNCTPVTSNNDTSTPEPAAFFEELLLLFIDKFQNESKAFEQMDSLGNELSLTYEELMLLYKLSSNMKITQQDANFLQMACDSLTDTVLVEGIAVLQKRKVRSGEKKLLVSAGSGIIDIDEETAYMIETRLQAEMTKGKEVLLDSDVDSNFKYSWPESVRNIIAVPLLAKIDSSESHNTQNVQMKTLGIMVAVNRIDKPDFDSLDAKLFSSVANSCAVFVENGKLFTDLKELFIGSLHALTNSIDAKDQYTRGHSERVAYVSKWIAERLTGPDTLSEDEIHRIYLAGLLHDIGKIGIPEAVLRKNGRLTDEEFETIRKHPTIGAGILKDIKQMRGILDGALYHHERFDGRGYPNKLSGKKIPLAGRIIGVADTFDAMTSKRSYRDAMSLEKALDEIEKGMDTQFDGKIAKVFLESDIHRLWEILQNGLNDIYTDSDTNDYGIEAVGTLVR